DGEDGSFLPHPELEIALESGRDFARDPDYFNEAVAELRCDNSDQIEGSLSHLRTIYNSLRHAVGALPNLAKRDEVRELQDLQRGQRTFFEYLEQVGRVNIFPRLRSDGDVGMGAELFV
ncbi:hypothetical protein FOZ62_028811, partial [Perkinsus olseni]